MNRDRRDDPYKNFKFAVAIAAISAVAVSIGRKLFAKVEFRPPGVYIEEVPTGARPIEGVGTSTAGFVGSAEKKSRRSSRQARAR